MVSTVRNQGAAVLAASLANITKPTGFAQFGRNEQKTIPGFSLATADLLFQPMTNIIDAENALLEQRMFQRFDSEPERVDARTIQNRMRNRDRIENPALRQTPEQVLEDLKIRFGISVDGPRTPFASVYDRANITELFSAELSGYTSDPSLTLINNTRIAVGAGELVDASSLEIAATAGSPDAVLVRLDSSVEQVVNAETGETAPGIAEGKLFLDGTQLAGNTVHQLTLDQYSRLQYESANVQNLDYLSVVGIDTATNTRGELATTAITSYQNSVERYIRDGLERFEFIAMTEANAPIPRVNVSFEGTFVNGDIVSDINAGVINVRVNQFGNMDKVGTNLIQQSSGNSLDVTFGSSPPVDGVVVTVKALDDAVDVSKIKVTFS